MKKTTKFLVIIILTFVLLLQLTNITLATTLSGLDAEPSHDFDNVGNSVIKILSTIGMIVSVIALIIIGIKYMIGSLEQKAEYKKTMMPYLIGAIFVFSASIIASIVYNVAKNI